MAVYFMKPERVNISDMPNMGNTITIPRLNKYDAKALIEAGGTPGTVEPVSGLQDVSFPIEKVIGNIWVGFDSPQNGYNEFVIDSKIYVKVYLGRYASVVEKLDGGHKR